MAVGEALRNSAKGMIGRALTGKHSYEQIPELAERGRARVPRFFEDLDGMLSDREYLAGDTYTVADITAFVTVEFAGWLKLGLTDDQTNAKRWYEAVKARPSSAL
jgi:glutathione S-transferase